jgi:flagellin-like protein
VRVRRLLTDDRAVAPVIAVLLLVAIVVVLAAVIGTFVLGVGDDVQSTPEAKFTFDAVPASGSGHDVTVTLFSGAAFTERNTDSVRIRNTANSTTWPLPIRSDDERTLGNAANGTDVRVVWYGPGNETSTTLATGTVPE